MNPEIYHIPANYTDAGRILGVFEIRNVIEAVLLALPTLYFCLVLLPFAPKAKLIVTIILVIPVGSFALIGIRDDSLTRWLKIWRRWRKRRKILYFRGEVTQSWD